MPLAKYALEAEDFEVWIDECPPSIACVVYECWIERFDKWTTILVL